jgi:hypothetical protein
VLTVQVEPVGAQVRAPITTDPGDDNVARFSEERLNLLSRFHP